MEILFLTYNSADSCSFYRSAGVAKDLRKKIGHNITVAQWPDVHMNWAFLNQFDTVMFQRPFTPEAAVLCDFIKNMGIKLWVDWDDNLFQVNPENETHETYSKPEIQKSMRNIMNLADVVTVPTNNLKIVLSGLNKNIHVIPNAHNDSIFNRDNLPRRTNNVIWRGPKSHIADLSQYRNAINKASEEFKDWRFMFLGYSPWFLNDTSNKAYLPMQDIMAYHRCLYDTAPACLHVPLADNPFNRCRSNVAYLEGSYAGAVCVAPDWWNAPGSLPYSDADSYYEALRAVLSGEIDIVVQNKIAWQYIQDELTLSKVNLKRVEVIESLV